MGCSLKCGDNNRCRECVGCIVITRDWEASPDTYMSQRQFPNLVDEEVELGVDVIVIPFRHIRWSVLDRECTRIEG